MALKSKNKLRFVEGTIPEPDEADPLFVAWDRCNTFVLAWILNSLSAEIRESVLWIENSSDLWRDLRTRYYQGDLFRVVDLQKDLFALK